MERRHIINSPADLARLAGSPDEEGVLRRLKGAGKIRRNQAAYPDGYDLSKQPGDDGYIAPDWQDEEEPGPAERAKLSKTRIAADLRAATKRRETIEKATGDREAERKVRQAGAVKPKGGGRA